MTNKSIKLSHFCKDYYSKCLKFLAVSWYFPQVIINTIIDDYLFEKQLQCMHWSRVDFSCTEMNFMIFIPASTEEDAEYNDDQQIIKSNGYFFKGEV